jgi:hypothetical protein
LGEASDDVGERLLIDFEANGIVPAVAAREFEVREADERALLEC